MSVFKLMRSRGFVASMAAALALSGIPVTADAGVTSYDAHQVFFRNDSDVRVRSYFDWKDEGTSAGGTWIQLFGCHFTDSYTGHPEPILRLVRARAFFPDAYLGERTFAPCDVGSSQNWGNQPAGTYHFDVVREDATFWPDSLHVSSTRVTY